MSDSKKDRNNMSVTQSSDSQLHKAFSDILRNDFHSFIVRKTEKLASALYIVTGFVPESDPLRTRVRSCALDLLSASADADRARHIRYAEGFASRCLEISSTLSLAERAGFVSAMNAKILSDEYAELALFVKRHEDTIFGSVTLEVGYAAPTSLSAPQKNRIAMGKSPAFTAASAASLNDVQNKRTSNHKRHSNRKDMIMRLLDKKDKISVKDAAEAIPGCSEKTIQRELISLVESGVLLKEGERRWSTYKKASVS